MSTYLEARKKLDDALNWLPARLTGGMLVVAACLLPKANGRNAAQTMLAQHHRTASPNAGWTMSAIAGALGITLTKRDTYTLAGGQQTINTTTLKRARHLADICAGLSVGLILFGLGLGRFLERNNSFFTPPCKCPLHRT